MALVKFLQGNYSALNSVDIIEGQILICKDEKRIFIDVDSNSRIEIGCVIPGMIMIWSGTVDNIPDGWVLCNGENGTPDLRDKFVIGAGGSYSVSDTGGEKKVSLSVDEIPSHKHNLSESVLTNNGSGNFKIINGSYIGNTKVTTINTTENTGNGLAHNNMPPYYALCYIMKI